MSQNIQNLMGVTMEKIKAMATADTMIGDPVKLTDRITAIPVSKISYAFASGGSDFPSAKTQKELFGGGGGAGMTVTPIAFLILQDDNVKILPVNCNASSADKLVSLLPDFFDRIKSLFQKEQPAPDQADSPTQQQP